MNTRTYGDAMQFYKAVCIYQDIVFNSDCEYGSADSRLYDLLLPRLLRETRNPIIYHHEISFSVYVIPPILDYIDTLPVHGFVNPRFIIVAEDMDIRKMASIIQEKKNNATICYLSEEYTPCDIIVSNFQNLP
eukprot:TRINITY_DN3419_c0_g1_i1.p1 TRINITY_DN3419_c0_g1~~TRINITY_DN3419_c0_g1_i1.p1  ORF type:complete len:133 (+),score=25.58 TRINITY_DN3419_c0_g1_i1:63-461(+)